MVVSKFGISFSRGRHFQDFHARPNYVAPEVVTRFPRQILVGSQPWKVLKINDVEACETSHFGGNVWRRLNSHFEKYVLNSGKEEKNEQLSKTGPQKQRFNSRPSQETLTSGVISW